MERTLENVEDGLSFAREFGFPIVFAPASSPNGTGTYAAYQNAEIITIFENCLNLSPVHQVIAEHFGILEV